MPGDVSVVGFDDVPEAEFQMVPLTTVADRRRGGGASASSAELVAMIEGADPAADADRAVRPAGAAFVDRSTARPAPAAGDRLTATRPVTTIVPITRISPHQEGQRCLHHRSTRRKFLHRYGRRRPRAPGCWPPAAAATSGTGGTPGRAGLTVPQLQRSTRPSTPSHLPAFWTWVPNVESQVDAVGGVPRGRGQHRQRRPGAPHYRRSWGEVQAGTTQARHHAEIEFQVIP